MNLNSEYESFLVQWNDSNNFITVKTSGSTGKPKQIKVLKEHMKASAENTCSFLRLNQNDTALLCLPLNYISGMMMVVRSIVCQLNLIMQPATGNPLTSVTQHIDFAAMTPMQVFNCCKNKAEKEKLKRVSKLIIGGGAISKELENELEEFSNEIYSTYGMTETVSHIALRRINGKNKDTYYTPFDMINLSSSATGTLIIDAPEICKETLETNDIVEFLPDGRFKITGRIDNTINSGGVKIQIEEIEQKLSDTISGNFAITSVPDEKFGEVIVLLHEDNLNSPINGKLSKYEQPKFSYQTNIPLTETGKINRKECKKKAFELHTKKEAL